MRSMFSHLLLAAAALAGLVACEGRNATDTEAVPAAGETAGSSARQGTSGNGGALSVSDGGMAGAVTSSLGEAGAAGDACATDADCAALPDPGECASRACAGGRCELTNRRKGTLIADHFPPDCQNDVCDGEGNVITVFDPTELPATDNPCLVGKCPSTGAELAPRPAATPCKSTEGGTRCDGAGRCVQCLLSKDCPSGQACVAYQCTAVGSCGDKLKSDGETDVDCGGAACDPCADGLSCISDQDCTSDACHPLTKTCSPATCIDQQQENGETDLDCGGLCRPCIPGQKCLIDADCASHKCDPAKHTCGGSTCTDKLEDGDETDVDCGGPTCGPCHTGQKCFYSFDCDTGCNPTLIPHVCN
jgi:hypothetical protein